jgi:hypothetical protein
VELDLDREIAVVDGDEQVRAAGATTERIRRQPAMGDDGSPCLHRGQGVGLSRRSIVGIDEDERTAERSSEFDHHGVLVGHAGIDAPLGRSRPMRGTRDLVIEAVLELHLTALRGIGVEQGSAREVGGHITMLGNFQPQRFSEAGWWW